MKPTPKHNCFLPKQNALNLQPVTKIWEQKIWGRLNFYQSPKKKNKGILSLLIYFSFILILLLK